MQITEVKKLILAEYRRQQAIPFIWGKSDCLCTCGDFAYQLYRYDPVRHLRGGYDSEIGARKIMKKNKWENMGDVAASIFNEVPVAKARWGDWAHIENPDGTDGLGTVVGAYIIVRWMKGLGYVPLLSAKRTYLVE
jgi:hypothetical protein